MLFAEVEFILMLIMITSYVLLVGHVISQLMNSFLRVSNEKRNFTLDVLSAIMTTCLYFSFYGYENKKYLLFIVCSFICCIIIHFLIKYGYSFFNQDIEKQISILKEKRNIQFYLRIINPYVHIMGFSIMTGFIISSIIPVALIYKLISVIIITQIMSFILRSIFSKKISYYDYLVDVLIDAEYTKVRIQDIQNFKFNKDFYVFEMYILEKILFLKMEESFFLIEKNKSHLSEVFRIKALIHYKMYSLIKVNAEQRLLLSAQENLIIDILKSIKNKDIYKAEIFFNKLDDENKMKYEDLKLIIINNQEISFYEHYDDINYYIVENEDFSRSNKMEKYFHKYIKFKLLSVFDNKCAKTNKDTEIEMDHFFIPKSNGGNFIMKRKDGRYVLNAIPLNKQINQLKSNFNYKDFFSKDEIDNIFIKINHLNDEINEQEIVYEN